MVSVSVETAEQTEHRLRQVIAAADIATQPGEWAFQEAPLSQPPRLSKALLAVVRDEDRWSWLAPATGDEEDEEEERFTVFSFHFPADLDNSGFVGWLAGTLKRQLGTGVFVVSGQNRNRGGIYDYWGCPASLGSDALQVINTLRGRS